MNLRCNAPHRLGIGSALFVGFTLSLHAAAPVIKGIIVSGATPQLTIQADVGTTNQIQSKTNLNQGSWVVLTNIAVSHSPYVFADNSAASVRRFYRVAVLGTAPVAPSGMAVIPAGSFTMGDANDGNSNGTGDAPTHTVNLSQFYIETNLVNYTLWQQVVTWATNNGYSFNNPGSAKGPSHPVQTMDWYDTAKWCNARSEMLGLVPCYYTDATQTTVFRVGATDLGTNFVKWSATGYRLPSEAEWEKAARGGLAGNRFPLGNTISEAQANYFSHTAFYTYDLGPDGYNAAYATGDIPYTSPVAAFPANGYALYDMAGNVSEWCWDWYSTIYYYSSPVNDPHGPASSTFGARILRGGAWDFLADQARCANRSYEPPNTETTSFGFRCVRGF